MKISVKVAAASTLLSLTLALSSTAQTLPDVTAIRIDGGGFLNSAHLVMDLKGTTRPEVTITKEGKTTVLTLREAYLKVQLPYVVENPGAGISRLEATQVDLRTVRIALTGSGDAPTVTPDVLTPNRLSLLLGGGATNGTATHKITGTEVADLKTPDHPEPSQNRQFSARAVAPPVGDVAIGNIYVDPPAKLGINDPITLVLKDAPAREVLNLMSRRAGLNVIFNDDIGDKKVSVDVQGEPLEQTFNLILRLAKLSAQRVDKTLIIGANLPQDLVQTGVRTFRLNQANVAQVLPQIQSLMGQLQETVYSSTDARTNSLTLVGSPRALKVAAAQIAQLDIRQRQVLISLKLVDVDLNDTRNLGVGFGLQLGKFAFGSLDTGNVGQLTRFLTTTSTSTTGGTSTNLTTGQTFAGSAPTITSLNLTPNIGNGVNNNAVGTYDSTSGDLPFNIQTRIQASIVAGNSKLLADPKVVLDAGNGVTETNNAKVDISDDVIVGTQITVDPATGLTTTTVKIDKAGVILDVSLYNIDDNGYVNIALKPQVTSIASSQQDATGNLITLLSRRNIDIKHLRLRDGQTLVLAGLIQDQDLVAVNKVPILGDLPLIGSLFRFENTFNRKREIALMVTPYIIKDPVESGTPPTSIKP